MSFVLDSVVCVAYSVIYGRFHTKATQEGVWDMNEIERSRVARIDALHGEILGAVRMTIDKVIEVGGLLAEQKADLRHGEWLLWAEKHLPFDVRTAQNYMKAHRRRDELKNESVSHLTEAYGLSAKDRVAAEFGRAHSLTGAYLWALRSELETETDLETLREYGDLTLELSQTISAVILKSRGAT